MNREYHKWYSSRLNRDMELLLFGHAGHPILVFPTSMGRFWQNEEFHMIATLGWAIEAGLIQVLCVDGIDLESWYNRGVSVHNRALRHNQYDEYIVQELIPFFRSRNNEAWNNLTVTGCSFGAYHALNFGLKHPDIVKNIVAMSGAYSLNFLLRGGHDEAEYLNSPLDYLPNLNHEWFLSRIRQQRIVLTTGSNDICLWSTRQMSEALWRKGIWHNLDIWEGGWHDWPMWRDQALKYLT